jgi:hypothetical protein
MKIYRDGYYRVIELNAEQFASLDPKYFISGCTDGTKYMLGNPKETEYLCETFDIKESELEYTDWFKLKLVKDCDESIEISD